MVPLGCSACFPWSVDSLPGPGPSPRCHGLQLHSLAVLCCVLLEFNGFAILCRFHVRSGV